MNFITIATEDELSEAVACRLVGEFLDKYIVDQKIGKTGNGYLKKSCIKFNNMARRTAVFLLTDLDRIECVQALKYDWFGETELHENLIFRVAVREIESWLIADEFAMRKLLSNGANKLEKSPDNLPDPKNYLLGRALKAPKSIRQDLVREIKNNRYQALQYNNRLCQFVNQSWCPNRAAENSNSLLKAIHRLKELNAKV